MEPQALPKVPKTKLVNYKLLKEGWSYYAVSDSDYVIGVKVDLIKLSRVLNDKSEPFAYPDGTPLYLQLNNVEVVALTKEEWKAKKDGEQEGF